MIRFANVLAVLVVFLALGPSAGPAMSVSPASVPISVSSVFPGATLTAAPGGLGSAAAGAALAPSLVGGATLLGFPGASTPTAMTYDASDGYMLLVTPTANATASGSATVGTWTFAAGAWTERTTNGSPPAREYAALTYDGQTGSVLLFGGYSSTGHFLSDTWEYSAGHWTNQTNRSTDSPSGRANAAIAYDAAGGYVVLVGGFGVAGVSLLGNLTDTWTYSDGNWTSVASSLSPPVEGAMAYDPTLSEIVYYGGVNVLGGCTSSTYVFNGQGWIDLTASITGNPGGLALESMTYDPAIGGVLAYGGACGIGIAGVSVTLSSSNSTWALVSGSWTRLALSEAPTPTYGGDFAYDPATGALVLFGGVHPSLVSVGTLHQQLSAATYLCSQGVWARLGPDLTSSLSIAETGMNVTFRVANSLASGPATFQYSGLPGPCSNATGPVVSCAAGALGTYRVGVNVSLSLGFGGSVLGTANDTSFVAVEIVSRLMMSPLESTLPVSEVGVPVTIWSNVSDGVAVSAFRFDGLPAGCLSGNRSSLTCVPQTSGSFPISLNVSDTLGVQDAETMVLPVAPRAAIGTFSLSRSTLDLGMETNMSAVVVGGVGPFELGWSRLPSGCAPVDSLSLSCSPNATGTFDLGFAVNDSLGVQASSTATLRVNPAPALHSLVLSSSSIHVGESATMTIVLSGGTAPFQISYSGLPSSCVTANVTVLECVPSLPGNYTIVVTATDSVGGSVHGSVRLTVEELSGGGPGRTGSGTFLSPFAEGLASGAALMAVLVSALFVRGRQRSTERRRLSRELRQGIDTEGAGLSEDGESSDPGPGAR